MTLTNGIHALDNSDFSQRIWNRSLGDLPAASFYHLFEWKTVNEAEFGHKTFYLASIDGESVTGVLPLVLIRSRLFGRILCSLPFVNYCGPAAATPAVEAKLVQEACEIARAEKVDYLEIRGKHVCDDGLPRTENKVSMSIPLSKDPDDIWEAFASKHRNNIRRVYKSGLQVRSGHQDCLDVFYELLSRSWRGLGTPIYRKRYFQSLLDTFGDKVRIFVAYQGDTPVATAFNGHFGKTVEGMWAGSSIEHRKLQSNYVLYWEMIKAACEDGYECFHLGRTSVDSGGEAFKKKWLADSEQLYWHYYLPAGGEVPQLNVDNPKYALAINAWRKMPLGLTRLIGPPIAKNIP